MYRRHYRLIQTVQTNLSADLFMHPHNSRPQPAAGLRSKTPKHNMTEKEKKM